MKFKQFLNAVDVRSWELGENPLQIYKNRAVRSTEPSLSIPKTFRSLRTDGDARPLYNSAVYLPCGLKYLPTGS